MRWQWSPLPLFTSHRESRMTGVALAQESRRGLILITTLPVRDKLLAMTLCTFWPLPTLLYAAKMYGFCKECGAYSEARPVFTCKSCRQVSILCVKSTLLVERHQLFFCKSNYRRVPLQGKSPCPLTTMLMTSLISTWKVSAPLRGAVIS